MKDQGKIIIANRSGIITFVALLIILQLPGIASANQPKKEHATGLTPPDIISPQLSEISSDVVYTASKRLQYTQEAPSIVKVFTREDILRGGFHSLNELIATIPEIELVDTGRSQYLLIKGTPFTLLALVDGVSVVNHGDNMINLDRVVPIEIVRKVEVVLSPGGVLWGAYSLYGVVNIITRELGDQEKMVISFTGGWWNTFRSATSVFSRWSDLRWQLHLSTETFRGSSRFVENSLYRPNQFGNFGNTENDVGYYIGAFGALSWRGFFLRALLHHDDQPFAINEVTGARLIHGYNSVLRTSTYLITSGYQRTIRFNRWNLNIIGKCYFYDQHFHDHHWQYPPSNLVPGGAQAINLIDHQIRIGANFEAQASYGMFNTILGMETFHSRITDYNRTEQIIGLQQEYIPIHAQDTFTFSLFGQQELSPHRDINLAIGARWNYSPSYKSAAFMHGHIVYEPIDGLFAKANYSEGFRPPSFEQRYFDHPQTKGSTELKQERTQVLEIQTEYVLSNEILGNLNINGGYAFAQLKNLIGVPGGSPPRYFENLSNEEMHTISASARYKYLDFASIGLGFAHHFPGKADDGLTRRDFAQNRVSLDTKVALWKILSVNLQYCYTGSRIIRDYLDPQTNGKIELDVPGYHELSLTARASLFETGLTLTATLRNLLFQDYDHTPPYTHIAEIHRGLFPQPDSLYAFFSIEYAYDLSR